MFMHFVALLSLKDHGQCIVVAYDKAIIVVVVSSLEVPPSEKDVYDDDDEQTEQIWGSLFQVICSCHTGSH